MLSLLHHPIAACSIGICLISMPANAELLPERVDKAAREHIAVGTHQTLVFGVVDGGKTEVVTFGKLDSGMAPDGDTVYEIGSVTKTFTATLLARAVLSGRVTLDTAVAQLLPDFKIPSRGGKEITLGELATQHSGLPREASNLLPKDFANPYADYDAARSAIGPSNDREYPVSCLGRYRYQAHRPCWIILDSRQAAQRCGGRYYQARLSTVFS